MPSSPRPYAPHRAKEGLCCLWLPGRCCLAGGLRGHKPTPKMFFLGEKADLEGKRLVCTSPSNPPLASSGGTPLKSVSDRAQNSLREAAFCELKLCSGNQPQPQCVFAQESNACLVLTWSCAPHSAKEGLGCLWLRGPCCITGGPRAINTLETCPPGGTRLIWQEKALFAQAPATHP